MKKRKIKYTDEPIGKITIIPDFLAKPEQLVFKIQQQPSLDTANKSRYVKDKESK